MMKVPTIPRGISISRSCGYRLKPSRQQCVSTTAYKKHTAKELRGYKPLANTADGHKEHAWNGLFTVEGEGKLKMMDGELQALLLTYGELAQATYDNLNVQGPYAGLPKYGPAEMLKRCSNDDNSAQPNNPDIPASTCDLYTATKFIYAQVHQLETDMSPQGKQTDLRQHADKAEDMAVSLITSNLGFLPSTPQKQPVWMAYTAISQDTEQQKDVAIAFRGTIFKDEWYMNVAGKELMMWNEGQEDWEKTKDVRVHQGFYRIYKEVAGVLPTRGVHPKVEFKLTPREVIEEELVRLLQTYDVATITTTGHSLGGALCTIAALDVVELLERKWGEWSKDPTFKTKTKPCVTAITFASPRVGDRQFKKRIEHHMQKNRLRILRVHNFGDLVPRAPLSPVEFVKKVLDRATTSMSSLSSMASQSLDGSLASMDASQLEPPTPSAGLWTQTFFTGVQDTVTQIVHKVADPVINDAFRTVGDGVGLDATPYMVIKEKDRNDSTKVIRPLGLGASDLGAKHNLEFYLYLISKQGNGAFQRDPALVNKSDDILKQELGIPACWWASLVPTMQRDPNGKKAWRRKDTVHWPVEKNEPVE